ncbi:unnamed protein product [Alopecurus aequalis]
MTTSDMMGRTVSSSCKHMAATATACFSSLPHGASSSWRSRGSISSCSLFCSPNMGAAHSTRFCSPAGLASSMTRLPVMSSSSTTPKLYTSDFTVRWPILTYSGAQYPYVPITLDDESLISSSLSSSPLWVVVIGPASLASPKSESLGWYPSSRRMLEDLKSRPSAAPCAILILARHGRTGSDSASASGRRTKRWFSREPSGMRR